MPVSQTYWQMGLCGPFHSAAGSSSESIVQPSLLPNFISLGSAPMCDFQRVFDTCFLKISIQRAQRGPGGLLLLGEPKKFATVQVQVFGQSSLIVVVLNWHEI